MRKLHKQDIVEILYGATLLGAGGGGSLCFGLDMLKKLEKTGEIIELDLLELDEIGDDEYAAMVAGLGSPVAMLDSKLPMFGPDAVHAFRAFQKAFLAEGKHVKYLYSGEMGGFNTFVPMLVAILSDKDPAKRIKFLDVDSNGRAVPELNTTLNSFYGFPPKPMGLGSYEGNQIAVYPINDHAGEQIARQMCMLYDMRIGFSTWGMNKAEMSKALAIGCVTEAQNIGKAFLAAKEKHTDLMDELKKVMTVREFCRGTIEKLDLKQEGGFDFGTTVVKGDDGHTSIQGKRSIGLALSSLILLMKRQRGQLEKLLLDLSLMHLSLPLSFRWQLARISVLLHGPSLSFPFWSVGSPVQVSMVESR